MEININQQTENPLLNRTEIDFDCLYQGEATPKVLEVKKRLVAVLDIDKKLLVVDKLDPVFGEGRAKGYAKLYDSEESLTQIERKHVLDKNQEPQKEEKEEEAEAKEETKAEEKGEIKEKAEAKEETKAEEKGEIKEKTEAKEEDELEEKSKDEESE